MISRSIGGKAFRRQSLQLFPFSPQLGRHRWLSASIEGPNLVHKYRFPVHARSHRRPPDTSRRKPVSLPLANLPVEIEQLVSVVRRKGNSADLDQCLDALAICISPHHVARALTLIDDAQAAIHFFAWAVRQPHFSHNVYTCTSLVTILARAKEFDKIWEFLSEMYMEGSQLTDSCFNVTIKAYGEMGNDMEAIHTLHKMREFGVSPTAYTFNTLISALVKSQKPDLAMEIYHEMLQAPQVKEDVYSLSMIVSALCNVGRLQEAREMATDAVKRGFSTSIIIWNSLINGFCKAGKVDKGIELFSMIKDMEIVPNEFTYGIIIGGLCKVGKLSDAMAYLVRMKNEGIVPAAITYTPLLNAICKAGRFSEGHDLLETISEDGGGGDAVQCSIFVLAFSQRDMMDEACAMYDKMVKNGCWPSASTYGVLIQGLCRAGRLKEALKIFNDMKEGKCEPNSAVYKVMVRGLAKAGFKDGAEKMFQEMVAQGFEVDATTYRALIKCLCDHGSLDCAKKTLGTMLNSCDVSLGTLCIYLKGLCDASQVDSAYQFLKEMLEQGFEPSTHAYNILIYGAFKTGDLEKALEMCSEMRSKGCDPDIYTYAELCKIAWKAKRVDALLDIYYDMRKQHVRANPFVFTIIIKALCMMNKVPEACSICSQIFEDGFVSSNSNELCSGLDKTNFFEIQDFLPLLIHLQDCGEVREMVILWDSIVQKKVFSWYEHSDVDEPETLE